MFYLYKCKVISLLMQSYFLSYTLAFTIDVEIVKKDGYFPVKLLQYNLAKVFLSTSQGDVDLITA
jgi:hypothetical protein